MIITPTVHLNGTSKAQLLEQNLNVLKALRDVRKAMAEASPHGRDYYPQGPNATNIAISQHSDRLAKLEAIRLEIEEITMTINDQS
jgi:hypothetical protein